MPLNTRELYLILRARDEASRVMRNMGHTMKQLDKDTLAAAHAQMARGQAMATIGTGIAVVGAAGIVFFKNAVQAAIEYNQQAAMTATQTDNVKVSIEQLKAMSDDVASKIPVPFETLQSALYDIFSSIDVTVPQAHLLLTEFAKSAVAGQVDIQTAGRATIAVLNAFKMPITDVTRVNDVMFQLVRKGVGTYEEFTKTIGRAIPSTARAGQSFETLAGMMAFMTRNGLSTAMASTSAARAMDAMSNPKTVDHFKKIGIAVKDAKGQFRPMADIMTDLGKKMAGLTKPQRAKALQALFLGSGGTIQARRFFDLAITNFDELNQRVDEMHHSAGAMGQAYDIMFKQPLTKMQLFQNNWKILQHQMGDALLPILAGIAKGLSVVLMWFNNLSPSTKKWVTIGLALASVLMVLLGLIVAVAGLMMMFAAAATMAGVGLGTVGIVIAAVVAAIAVFAVGLFLLIKYHKQIQAFVFMVWNAIKNFLISVWTSITTWVASWAPGLWTTIVNAFQAGVAFVLGVVQTMVAFWKAVWTEIWVWIGPILGFIWGVISNTFKAIFAVISFYVKMWWLIVSTYVKLMWNVIKFVFTMIWKFIGPIIQIIYQIIRIGFQVAYVIVSYYAKAMWAIIKWAWSMLLAGTRTVWNLFKTYIINPVRDAYNTAKGYWTRIAHEVAAVLSAGIATVKRVWAAFTSAIIDPVRNAANSVGGFLDGIANRISGFVDKITAPLNKARDLLSKLNPAAHFSPSVVDRSRWGWEDMLKVSKAGIGRVRKVLSNNLPTMRMGYDAFVPDSGPWTPPGGPAGPGGTGGGGGNYFAPGAIQQTIHTQEIDPIKHAADLGWEVARQM